MPIIPSLGRLRQEDYKFKASMGYIKRFVSNKQRDVFHSGLVVLTQAFKISCFIINKFAVFVHQTTFQMLK
jgi:hypothetical protein